MLHEPTAFEQEMMELVNRARMDPVGEFEALIKDAATQTGTTSGITAALRYFDVDLDMFLAQLMAFDAVAPLAWNGDLAQAADGHSQEMIDHDTQSHQLPGEASLVDRIEAAGYDSWSKLGENVFAYTEDPVFGHAGFMIDWGYGPGGMQDPAGHRNTILSANYTEIGISALAETDTSTQVGPWVVTQDFGNRTDYVPQLLGVVIKDADGDAFYDRGEGLGGVSITVLDGDGTIVAETRTWSAGGYQTELAAGDYTVVFWGGKLKGSVTRDLAMGRENAKIDIDKADARLANDFAKGGAADDDLNLGGGQDVMLGRGGNDTLAGGGGSDLGFGGSGRDVLTGARGNDTLAGGGHDDRLTGGDGHDRLQGDAGDDTIDGGAGRDRLAGGGDRDVLKGGGGADRLDGGDQSDVLQGGAGGDVVIGGSGRDRALLGAGDDLFRDSGQSGAGGSDTVNGGAGDDTIEAAGGNDVLSGQGGADTFVFSAAPERDVITDFEKGVDTLALTEALWGGGLTRFEVVQTYAQGTAGGVLFDFGNGHEILLEGLGSQSGLAQDLDLI